MARLRLIATSDLHMALDGLAHSGGGGPAPGLARLVPRLLRLRREAPGALYLDNGDLLQGNPLADHLGHRPMRGLHPAIGWLNALRCDAATLGNHDLAYGPRWLARVLAGAAHPVVASNLRLPHLPLPPFALLRRTLPGHAAPLRIGILGFLPPQTALWEAAQQPGLEVEDIPTAAARLLPRLRAAGADVVVALAHSGLGTGDPATGDEDAALALARLPGIDAVIAGHSHLPAALDSAAGQAALVLPGPMGAHLGVIDLSLTQGDGGWRVAAGRAWLEGEAGVSGIGRGPVVEAMVQPAGDDGHEAARRAVALAWAAADRAQSVRVGRTAVPLRSHAVHLGRDAGLALVGAALRWHVKRSLPDSGLPVLAAVAPFRSGGRSGPAHFTDIPAGRLTARDLATLDPFGNRIAVLRVTGADLRELLERSAAAYATLQPGVGGQPLLDARVPGYLFDVVFGVTWSLDLSAPPLFSPEGLPLGGPGRVRSLCHRGVPVADTDAFALATTDYRLAAVGLQRSLAGLPRLLPPQRSVRQILRDWLRRKRTVAPDAALPFRLLPLPAGTAAWIDTAPDAAPGLGRPLGLTPDGFGRVEIALDAPLHPARPGAI